MLFERDLVQRKRHLNRVSRALSRRHLVEPGGKCGSECIVIWIIRL